jgi:ABC-type phosphate transport system auxiliary subunit
MPRQILMAISSVIDDFIAGRSDVADLQQRLEANSSALDRSYEPLNSQLRSLDTDLEQIQFTMLKDEQRPAAMFRLESVQEAVRRLSGSPTTNPNC